MMTWLLLPLLQLCLCSALRTPPWPTATAQTSTFPKEAMPTKSGYLPIPSKNGSSIFYAYYESTEPHTPTQETPIILWLQGGPGCSGMIGNFYEMGPWRIAADGKLHRNAGAWNRLFGLLFVDNPVGTGFSIAADASHIPQNQTSVAADLYAAISHFIRSSNFAARPFYVTGESYAGKYVPSLTAFILKRNAVSASGSGGGLRLAGAAIGNGLTYPQTQVLSHAAVAYAFGIIDAAQRSELEGLQKKASALAARRMWAEAHQTRIHVLRRLENMTGLATLYDVRRRVPYYTLEDGTDYLSAVVESAATRAALGVAVDAPRWESCSAAVEERLSEDVMKSEMENLEFAVRRVRVLLYVGQFDIRDGVVSMEDVVSALRWEGLSAFLDSPREVWKEDGAVAGYVRSYSNLSHVVVVGAGHLLPADQSVNSQRMIEGWINSGTASLSFQEHFC